MTAFTQAASSLIADHRAWAGLLLGVIAFGESMVIVGAFVPATVLLVAAGGLIASGLLDAGPVILWASLGAALGDALSFRLGERLGPGVLRRPFLAKHAKAIARTRLLIRRYGLITIYLGRFAGPFRAFVPVMAGMMHMPNRRFQPANAMSALAWVIAFLTPGYLTTKGMTRLGGLNAEDVCGLCLSVVLVSLTVLGALRLIKHPAPPGKTRIVAPTLTGE